jgi:hypothetical protein
MDRKQSPGTDTKRCRLLSKCHYMHLPYSFGIDVRGVDFQQVSKKRLGRIARNMITANCGFFLMI